jgi:hypothetical protein
MTNQAVSNALPTFIKYNITRRNMKTYTSAIAFITALSVLAGPSIAQGKKIGTTPATKAATTQIAKPKGPIVLGTTQLPGDFGQVGQTYTIGQREPINFTLKSAEYSVLPFTVDLNTWVPKAEEKLLILRYTVHNPIPQEQGFEWYSLRFTAVDAKDTNHDFVQAIAREGTSEKLSIRLKPAQKVDVVAAILVPAEGVVPKLIVQREQNGPVIRYDLRGKAKALPQGIADPADPSGATALKVVPAQPGAFNAIGVFDARLDEVAYTTEALARRALEPGKHNLTAVFTIRNRTAGPQTYTWSDFVPVLKDSDGEKAPYTQALLKASRDEKADGTLAPGEEARIRFFFPLPQNVTGKTLTLAEGKRVHQTTARAFAFDLTGAK